MLIFFAFLIYFLRVVNNELYLFWGVSPITNAVIASGEQQRDSAIHTYVVDVNLDFLFQLQLYILLIISVRTKL